MIAEVIAIGDELTSGQRLDTNSQWLSERLGELGIRVLYHSTVADDLPANVRVFLAAFDRADVIVASGGLGPTADDLTRHALAEATGTQLELDTPSLEHICSRFARSGRKMPRSNEIQAMFPAGSRIIFNPEGTAPGIEIEVARDGRSASRIFALPGVPAEMRQMWHAAVAPALSSLSGQPQRVIRHRRLKCFGVGESHLEEMLPDLIRRGRTPSVGITVHHATITLRITAEGRDEREALAAMEPTVATIRGKLQELVFGEGDDELENIVTDMLESRCHTLATAECATGGLLSSWMTEAAGLGECFRGGVVVRNTNGLQNEWKWAKGVSGPDDMCSEAVARQLAVQVRRDFETDYGLATSEFPRTSDIDGEQPEYYLALADEHGVESKSSRFLGHPHIWRERGAKQALDLLRRRLLRQSAEQNPAR